MTPNSPSSKSLLDIFLEQDQETISARAQKVDLEEPHQAQAEQMLLLALFEKTEDTPDLQRHTFDSSAEVLAPVEEAMQGESNPVQEMDISIGSPESPVYEPSISGQDPGTSWSFSKWLPVASVAVLCLLLGIGGWSMLTERPDGGHKLIPKGKPSPKDKKVVLQVSQWDATAKRLVPVRSGETLRANKSLVFGVMIKKHNGFLSLLHQRSNKADQIFPFPGTHSNKRKPQKQVQLLQQKGPLQRYTLDQEQGKQSFLLLYTKRRLTPHEYQLWEHVAKQKKDLSKQLKQIGLSAIVYSVDTFTLYVQRRKNK